MTFNTLVFYPFFVLVVLINYALPKKWRWVWLLAAGFIFYSFSDVNYLAILLVTTAISYFAGLLFAHNSEEKQKRLWFLASLVILLLALFLLKYLDFFFDTINLFFSQINLQWNFRGVEWIMPLGISFYVLQQISYLVDVYSGKSIAHKNFAQYALYISFFPKLLIGPIERFDHLMPQLLNPQPFVYQNFIDNLVRIVWALFKKMVIADRLAVVANSVFTSPRDFYSPQLLIGVLAFTFQIYIDFSAYSEIALATAGILGVELTNNFDRPYFSRSLTEFWRKWHISLSTWLRDYVFLPLNFKYRRKNPRELWTAIGIIITFLISGIWHGAGWTFIVWGLMHGLYQAIELLTQKWRNHNPNSGKSEVKNYARHLLEIVCTFSFVSFSWIFFKANSVKDALSIIFSILTLEGTTAKNAWIFSNGALGLDSPDFSLLLVTLIFLVLIEIAQTRVKLLPLLNTQPTWFRWIIYIVLIFSITIFGFYGENIPQDFVYFKF